MSTLLTRMFSRPRAPVCADCQVGQGRDCACRPSRKVGFRWPSLSDTAWLWLLIVLDVAALVLAFKVIARIVRSWSGA